MKELIKRLIIVLAIVLFFTPNFLRSEELTDQSSQLSEKVDELSLALQKINEARESVVLVKVSYPDNLPGWGTGFFIGEDLIITALHVLGSNLKIIQLNNTYNFFEVQVIFSNNDIDKPKILAISPQNDLAILKTNIKRKPLLIASKIENDEDVWFCGFDSALKYRVTKSAVLMEFKNFSFDILGPTFRKKDIVLIKDLFVPGNSGGPIFNKKGEVVGLIIAFYSPDMINGFGIAISQKGILNMKNFVEKVELK